ncbi:ABC transporter ATP-binding protein [Actimicrobium sp. CCC2.4]|uniref:ABC transporter ATP-binding protein n=1 Tax=Actimicrobium sp. CCC2.4 TaxID=3048606 RepID=UPI002AC9DD1E|nr:ABC transporter ATP-binding protein [Actimicrobium sp. CCC2.4]MEB0136279.1 ABC transporter ATP-binding protein [Actimicrobium sp. CCC2.4]WPX33623.1 ABC transporter ATP-binding protein [Actimicrobium sp. CCC2.4]
MRLVLENTSKKQGAQHHLYPLSLALVPGTINVLLGTTQAGKTTLMRIMAGLDRPTRGRVLVDDQDVTGVPVRQRNLAMVYQQFINYPSFSVFENIASPLRIQRVPEAEIRTRVHDMAERLHITPHLERVPAQLSGGQQQRCALARALIKNTELLLLDEPLVNLDYKLREELRKELSELFSDGRTTVVYATTEPLEALQLGGHIAVLHEGRLLQQGRTLDVFNAPNCINSARTFSDPPINLMPASVDGKGFAQLGDGLTIPLTPQQRQQLAGHPQVILGLRAHSLRLTPEQSGALPIATEVDLSEISGSETYAHLHRGDLSLVAQLSGVHALDIGARCTVYFKPDDLFIFDPDGALLFAPVQPTAGA